jgi:outer membrane protein assembly factor BamD
MKVKIFLNLILIIFLCISCSKKIEKKSVINENSLDLQVFEAYKEGIKSLESGDVLYAAKKFNEVEVMYPQSSWAPKSALMAAYSYYVQDYYGDAVAELIRFQKVYPKHKNLDYSYYLLGLCYYEQIVDEKKDLQAIINAKDTFNILLRNHPETEYSIDADFKLDLINDILASKEMYIGRYYISKKKWIPAINRFRTVVDEYETTIYVEEALHRLVEVYFILGLREESQKYASVLGYNYKSSQWYKKTYSVFNKNYKEVKIEKKKEKSILSKFKSLLELDE